MPSECLMCAYATFLQLLYNITVSEYIQYIGSARRMQTHCRSSTKYSINISFKHAAPIYYSREYKGNVFILSEDFAGHIGRDSELNI